MRDMVFVIEKTNSLPSWLVHKEPAWLCEIKEEIGNSKEELNDYILEPFPEHEFEPLNWNDMLATMDVCANIYATRHCDEEGYDVVPVWMVQVVNSDLNEKVTQEREKFHHEEVSIEDLSLAESADDEFCEEDSDEDFIVPESELEKIQILLRGREEKVDMEIPGDKPKHKFCNSHRKFQK